MKFTTLDETERQLESDMLMICDGQKAIAVAGVMGGLNSEVTDSTTNILLESACFNAVSVRKTGRKLNLSTDASYRFERGVDPDGTINALNRAVELRPFVLVRLRIVQPACVMNFDIIARNSFVAGSDYQIINY